MIPAKDLAPATPSPRQVEDTHPGSRVPRTCLVCWWKQRWFLSSSSSFQGTPAGLCTWASCRAVTRGAVRQSLWQPGPSGSSAFSTRPGLEPPLSLGGDWPLEWVAADGKQAPPDFHSQQEPGAQYFPSYLLASTNKKTSKPSCQPRGTGRPGPSVWSTIIAGGCVVWPLWASISWCYQYLTTEQGAKAGRLQPLLSHSEGHGLMWYAHRKL